MVDLNSYVFRQPQNLHSDTMSGVYKGIVIDVRDPMSLGRVRVHVYSLHGDYAGIDVDSIPWSEVVHSGRGEFAGPELWDRVIVSFEGGDKQAPIVLGFWRANPAGRGRLPYSKRVGPETNPMAWHNRGLYPESNMVSCDGPGNAIWTEAKIMNGNSMASSVNLVDTGGKQIRVKSLHPTATPYSSIDKIPDDTDIGDLSEPVCTPTNNGFTAPKVAGSIELNQQNVTRKMQSSSSSASVDQMVQQGGISEYAISGIMKSIQQNNSALTLFNNNMSLATNGSLFINNSLQTPRILT